VTPAWLLAGALGGGISVALGAVGSHAVADVRAAAFLATASQYGAVHGVALVALAALAPQMRGFAARLLAIAAWLFVAGLVLFSGGLAAAGFTGIRGFVHVVPFGGGAYILGWGALLVAAFKAWRETRPPR
jgi:uncharacterized membrane protein YgdD (TMEM256/DUF423 family)